MTIKLDHETILRVPDLCCQLQRRSAYVDSDSIPIPPQTSTKAALGALSYVDLLKSPNTVEDVPGLTSDDDDTLSTASMSSDEETVDRRVVFCDEVVTQIWYRPFTEKDDIPNLYYSSDDTARFLQEYRLEKKLLAEVTSDPDVCHVVADKKDVSVVESSSPLSNAYRISRVVVLHNDKLETFVDHQRETNTDGFFDNDSFWSGSITWY